MLTGLALRNEGSLEGFSSQTARSPDPHPYFSTLPLISLNPMPGVHPGPAGALKSALNNTRPLTSARHSSNAPIPFRITSFADPYHITPIESHLYKKQGRGE